VTAPDNFTIDDEYRANGDTACVQAFAGFFNCGSEVGVHPKDRC